MLDHDEERRLAEIEDQLRLDDPEWLGQFEASVPATAAEPHGHVGDEGDDRPHPAHPVLNSVLALSAALILTGLVTVLFGPDLGGLVAVMSLCIAGMYAYQLLRGCPGLRSSSDDD